MRSSAKPSSEFSKSLSESGNAFALVSTLSSLVDRPKARPSHESFLAYDITPMLYRSCDKFDRTAITIDHGISVSNVTTPKLCGKPHSEHSVVHDEKQLRCSFPTGQSRCRSQQVFSTLVNSERLFAV